MTMSAKALLKVITILILGILCLTGIGESRDRDEFYNGSAGPDIDTEQLAKKIHNLVNRERAKKGLPTLLWDEGLHRVARKYSKAMVEHNFFSHNDPDGRCFYDRYKAEGIECKLRIGDTICMGAENIAQTNLFSSYYYRDGKTYFNWSTEDNIAEAVLKMWMNSKGHRANILTPYFKRQGIGVVFTVDGKVYVTENFC